MAKRCVKGKSCSATCISRAKICQMGLLDTISGSIDRLVRFLREKITDAVPALRNRRQAEIDRGREERRTAGATRAAERSKELENSTKFAEKVQAGLPKGFKAEGDNRGIKISGTTRSGHKIEMDLVRSGSIDFKVNGQYAVGTVTNRKEQLEVAMAVKQSFGSIVGSLKEGATLITSAFFGDDKEAARQKAYQRIGFSAPLDTAGHMLAKKENGKLVPYGDAPKWERDGRAGNAIEGDFSENLNQAVKDWLTAIFGVAP